MEVAGIDLLLDGQRRVGIAGGAGHVGAQRPQFPEHTGEALAGEIARLDDGLRPAEDDGDGSHRPSVAAARLSA